MYESIYAFIYVCIINLKVFEVNVISQNEVDIFLQIVLIWNLKGGSNFGLSASFKKFVENFFTACKMAYS